MKIQGITVRLSPLLFALIVFFAAVCAMLYGATNDLSYVYLAVPFCLILLLVPLFTSYMSEKQILEQEKSYLTKAKFVRAKDITSAMLGRSVLIEGKILKVTGVLMNKPSYLLMDATGEVVVKRFALPETLVGVGAQVEVLGTVARKISNADVVYINAITIRPIQHLRTYEEPETSTQQAEKIKIKKFN